MKKEIISNMLWRLMERLGAKGISMLVQIILARLLMPEYYGTVALITVFVSILEVFVDSGLGTALIQKQDVDELDFSTVFFFNILMCSSLYLLLFLAAPCISEFYRNPGMTPVIRVVGLTLIISGVKNIQQAYVGRNMLFRKFFFSTFGGTLISAVIGVALAYAGAGVWALVAQQLSNTLIDTVILWITVGWRPKLQFSWRRFRILFSFGWKLLIYALMESVYEHLSSLIISRKYTQADLAYYNQGQKLPSLIIYNLNTAIISVMFPVMSQEQTQPEILKAHVKRTIQISSYIIWPMMLGIAACAEPLVSLLLTDKWMPAVPFLRISCISFGFFIFHTSNLQAISALGKSDVYLRLGILTKITGVTILLLAVPHGILAIAFSSVAADLVETVINSWPNRKLLNYPYREQMSDMLPSMLLSGFMALVVYQINHLGFSPLMTLALQVPTGVLIYLAGSILFRLESYQYLLNTVLHMLRRP